MDQDKEDKKILKKLLSFFLVIGILFGIFLIYFFSTFYADNPDSFQPSTADNTLSDLTTSNFASKNVSQWTNDSGYLTEIGFSQIINSEGAYLDYRPGGSTCYNDQILKYDANISGWVCAYDSTGVTSSSTATDLTGYATQDWVNSQGFIKSVSYTETDPTLSYWTGSSNINRVGTITNGTWNGSPITSTYIQNGTIQFADIGQNSCTDDQIIKWNSTASAWQCATDDAVSGTVDWSSIVNRPTGLDDGDDDTQLTDSEVDTFVENGTINLASGSTLNSENIASQVWVTAQGYITTDTDTHLSEAQVEGYITNGAIDLNSSTTIGTAQIATQNWVTTQGYLTGYTETDPTLSSWNGSTNINTLGTISSGTWNGTPISAAYIEQSGCSDGQILKWNNTASAWQCAADDNSGTGIVDWSAITNRPAGLDDGDDDTNLAEAEVEAYIKNDTIDLYYTTTLGGANIATQNWVTAQGYVTIDTDTHLTEAEVESYIINDAINLFSGTTLNGVNIATEDWVTTQGYLTGYTETDPGLATFTGTSNIATVGTITSGTWNGDAITSAYIEDGTIALTDIGQNGCTDGQILKWNNTGSTWQCAVDDNSGTGTVDWTSITSRPAGLDDGDDDTQLSDAEVDAYVENSSINLATGSTINSQNIATENWVTTQGYITTDTDTHLSEAEVEGYITNGALDLFAGTTLNTAAIATESWVSSQGYLTSYAETDPGLATFAGTSNITTVGNITSGNWNGTIQDGIIELVDIGQNGCTDGQVLAWNGTSSAWECTDQASTASVSGTSNGEIEYIVYPTNFTVTTTPADIPTLTITQTLETDRRYVWTFRGVGAKNTANTLFVQITDENDNVLAMTTKTINSSWHNEITVAYRETGTGASVTRKVRAYVNGQTFTFHPETYPGEEMTFALDDVTKDTGGIGVATTTETIYTEQVIYEETLTAPQASFDIQNIDQAYDHLEIKFTGRSENNSEADVVYIYFNNDKVNANYKAARAVSGTTGADFLFDRAELAEIVAQTALTNEFSPIKSVIQNYADTNLTKTILTESSEFRTNTIYYHNDYSTTWKNTSAINRITLELSSGSNFSTGTTIQITGKKSIDVITDLTGNIVSPEWTDIQNRPTGLDDGDDDTHLSEAEVEEYITNGALDLFAGTTLNTAAIATESWVSSQGYLTSYAETDPTLATWAGTSNITTVGTITSGTWNGTPITSTYIEDGTIALADIGQNGCTDGQTLTWNETSSAWECADQSGGGTVSTTKETIIAEETIYEETLASSQAIIDIQNIDQTYDDIEVFVSARSADASGDFNMVFNNDSNAGNYRRVMQYYGSSSGGGAGDSYAVGELAPSTATAGFFSITEILLPQYADTSTAKRFSFKSGVRRNSTDIYTFEGHTYWSNTSAINRITFTPVSGNFAAGTTVKIVGKKSVDVVTDVIGGGTSTPEWTDILNRPAGLDDGDDVLSEAEVEGFITNGVIDLAAGTTLGSANIATETWVTSQGYITTDTDTHLSEGEVENYITNAAIDLAANSTVGGANIATEAWVTGQGYITTDTDTHLTEAEVEGYITNDALDLFAGTTLNSESIATESWVTSQGFLTSYTETDPGLTTFAGTSNIATVGNITSGNWNGTIQDGIIELADLGQNGCTDGQVLAWNGTSSTWECADQTANSGSSTTIAAKMSTSVSVQSIPTNTNVKADFDTVEFDSNGMTDTTNDQFVIQEDGQYNISTYWRSNVIDSGEIIYTNIEVNGITVRQDQGVAHTTNQPMTSTVNIDLDLKAGDTVAMILHQTSGETSVTSLAEYHRTEFSIFKIGGGTASSSSTSTTTETIYTEQVLYEETLTANQQAFNIPSIDQSYDNLKIYIDARSTQVADFTGLYTYFNGDTTQTNYYNGDVYGGTSNGGSGVENSIIAGIAGDTAYSNEYTSLIINIPNYTSTSKIKSAYNTYGNRVDETTIYSHARYLSWENTSAINQITFSPSTGVYLAAGSTIRVVGTKEIEVVTSTGSGTTELPSWLYNIDAPKAVADPPDDEFNSTSLDTKWNVLSGSSGTITPLESGAVQKYDLSSKEGKLLIQSDSNRVEFRQDYAIPDGKSIVMSLSGTPNGPVNDGDNMRISLALNDDDSTYSSGNYAQVSLEQDTSSFQVQAFRTGGTYTTVSQLVNLGEGVYFKISRIGTKYSMFASKDAATWTYLYSSDDAVELNNIWIRVQGPDSYTYAPIVEIDWIRLADNGAKLWNQETISFGSGSGGISINDPITGATEGSILFIGTGGIISQDNTNFFWDLTNSRLGIGTNSPDHTLDVAGNIGLSQNAYINFGATDGETGYGFRDKSGKINVKNQSGEWFLATPEYIYIRDEKAIGTDGGTFTSGSWQTRDLNTEVNDDNSNATLTNNQITLQPGTYRCSISAPAQHVGRHQARLYNITDGVETLIGTPEQLGLNSYASMSSSTIRGEFTISTAKTFEVQHICANTRTSTGFGAPGSWTTEIYTEVECWKVK